MLLGLTSVAAASPVFQRALAALAQQDETIDAAKVRAAAWVADIELDPSQCEEIAKSVQSSQASLKALREFSIPFDVVPACTTQTLGYWPNLALNEKNNSTPDRSARPQASVTLDRARLTDEDVAFLPISQLSQLIRSRQLSSVALTQLYLERLKRFNPILNCVVNLTEELAMKQARQADAEIATGRYRGPLHGIPWGAKDLIAVAGYPTTWGIPQFRDRVLDSSATVYRLLESAGAVLIAKLSLGAIAMGDRWFGGMTRSPWNPRRGSSGSSAGSASATAAGLVGFALGSETLGSIISPSRVCGTSSLRPTFGRVGRGGCMSLSWSMDKLGAIARSIEDCALVFDAMHGHDPLDPASYTADFRWPHPVDFGAIRIGYSPTREPVEQRADLQPLRDLGASFVEVKLPDEFPLRYLTKLIDVEGAAEFETMLRGTNGRME